MQILVDISEEDYNQILNDKEDAVVARDACRQIAKGIVVPKHDRLIDAKAYEEAIETYKNTVCYVDNVDMRDCLRILDQQPTVLEASKE